MTKSILIFIAAVPLLTAQTITNVRMIGVSNTQAILAYVSPDQNPCTLQVSTSGTYSPSAHDVDVTLFPNSNLDTRVEDVTIGRAREVILGERRSDIASDGLRYSRALQAGTQYFYAISCASGVATASGTFTTDTIRFGRTYTDTPPVDPVYPGSHAWPTVSYTNRAEQVIDPQTGALIKHVSLPHDRSWQQSSQNQAFVLARGAAWSNPNNVLANDSASATIGNSTAKLYISPNGSPSSSSPYFSEFHAQHDTSGVGGYSLDWMQVTVIASSSNAACNSSSPTTCQISACLTLDNISCYPGSSVYTQALTTTLTPYTFGTQNVIDLWQSGANNPPSGNLIAVAQGSVTCNGTGTVALASGDPFQPTWIAGSNININGTDFSIVGPISSTTSVGISGTCLAGTYPYYASNFGVLVSRTAANSDTISVQYASASYQIGILPLFSDDGSYYQCSIGTVVGNNGDPGFICSMLENGALYWIDSITAESHFIALFQNFTLPNTACGTFDSNPFDPVNANVLYCGGSVPTTMTYFGNYLEPTNSSYPGYAEEGVNIPTCAGSGPPYSNQPCFTYASLTGTTTMGALTSAFDPSFQSDRFLNWYVSLVMTDGRMLFRNWRSNYGSIAWTVVYDPNATSNGQPGNVGCVGGGVPGCVVAAMPSWNRPGFRWCPVKGNEFWSPGWISNDGFYWGGGTTAGMGPYQVNVTDGTALATGTGVAGGLNACPSNTLGVSGNLCTTFTVGGDPYDPSPCVASAPACNGAVETGAPGELGPAAVGDYFTTPSNETLRIVAISGNSWSVQRGWQYGGALYTTSANPILTAMCNCNANLPTAFQPSSDTLWNYTLDPHGLNSFGQTILSDMYSLNAHAGIEINNSGSGQYLISSTNDPRCYPLAVYQYCYENRFYTAANTGLLATTQPSVFVQQNPSFAGKFGPAQGNQTQLHPAGPGRASTGRVANFGWDGRPFNGGPLSGSQPYDGNFPATLVAGQLWRFPAANATMDRKFLPTFAANGRNLLLDVSGPSSSICTGSTCAYQYCVALIAGECYSGSSAGDVYANAPIVDYPYCHNPSQVIEMSDQFDICIGNNSMVYNSIMQFGTRTTDNYGGMTRMISKGLSINRLLEPFYHPEALANGQWIITAANYINNVTDEILAIQVPPLPTPDSVNRADFIPISIASKPPSGTSVSTAVVEFGYAEYSPANPFNLYCTSRAEKCAVGPASSAAVVNESTPFYFETTEAASLPGTPCATGCTIAIPAISGRVLYFRTIFRNSGGTQIAATRPLVYLVP